MREARRRAQHTLGRMPSQPTIATRPSRLRLGRSSARPVPLAGAITESWQYAVLAGSVVLMLVARWGVVTTLLLAGTAGVLAALLGAQLPS